MNEIDHGFLYLNDILSSYNYKHIRIEQQAISLSKLFPKNVGTKNNELWFMKYT